MPRILFIVPSDYDALKAKGVEGMIFERDEGGFFERVVTVHPAAYRSRIIDFNDVFVLHELGLDLFGRASRSRFFRALISPFQFFRAVSAICKLVRSERIDLIRANDPFWIGLIGLTAARLTGRPLCVSIHADYDKCEQLTGGGDTYTFFGMRWPARMVCRRVLSSANMVMPIRESLRHWAVSNSASPKRIRVIPHGIDLEAFEGAGKFNFHDQFGIPAGRRIISFTGRLSQENYLADIIETVRRLAMRRSDFCLIIVGEGELGSRLKGMVDVDPILSAVVRLTGFQSRDLCFALRRQSVVSLCLMGGYSLIEACLARSPVISYDVEWHKELVQTDRTGFLIPEGDIDGVVRAIEQCLDEPARAIKLGEEAYGLAALRHELKRTSQIKRACYEELLRHDNNAGMGESQNVRAQIKQRNNWYVKNQFDQLDRPGTKVIIEGRWKYFGDIFLNFTQTRFSQGLTGQVRCLDAGCGDGINLRWAADFFQKHSIEVKFTALDYNSLRTGRVAEKQLAEEIHVASLLGMPFKDSTFDMVLCSHVLEHIKEYTKALAEILRTLKPGGLLLLAVPNEGCFMAWLRNMVIQRSIMKKTDHVNFFRSDTLTEVLKGAGFKVAQVYREGFFLPHFWMYYGLTCFAWGGRLLSMLGRFMPSQSGDLIVYAIKPMQAHKEGE